MTRTLSDAACLLRGLAERVLKDALVWAWNKLERRKAANPPRVRRIRGGLERAWNRTLSREVRNDD